MLERSHRSPGPRAREVRTLLRCGALSGAGGRGAGTADRGGRGRCRAARAPVVGPFVRRVDPERGARAPPRPMGGSRTPAPASPPGGARLREHAERRPPGDHRDARPRALGASELRPARRHPPPLVLALESSRRRSRTRATWSTPSGRSASSGRAARSSTASSAAACVTSGTGRSTCVRTCRMRASAVVGS